MVDFKVGELVEELRRAGTSSMHHSSLARALVVRVCPPEEHPGFHNRQVVEVQWVASGIISLQFNGDLRRVKQ